MSEKVRETDIDSIHVKHNGHGITIGELVGLSKFVPGGTVAADCECCDLVFRRAADGGVR